MRLALVAALLLTVGCSDETRTREVDRPDTAPMELPEFGWFGSFTMHLEDSNGEDVDYDPVEFSCYLKKHTYGAAADYCGFTVYVTGDAFSFDTEPYRVESWYYGWITVQVSGAGDADGAEIHVKGESDGGYSYRYDYEVNHLGEL